jgi:hypothetical protein
MPRANRHYIPGYVWHITHPCGEVIGCGGSYELKESPAPYKGDLAPENEALRLQNEYFWEDSV